MKKIKAISLVITILIMALIFFFSSQTSDESTEVSDGLILKIIGFFNLTGPEKAELVNKLSFFVRKAAHFTIFAALGLSVIITVKSHCNITNIQSAIRAMLICTAYAFSDEIHQNFVSGRTMKFSDVLIDSAGSLLGVFAFFILYRCFSKFINSMKGEKAA